MAEFTLTEKEMPDSPPPNSKSLDIDDSLLDEFENNEDSDENLTDDIL